MLWLGPGASTSLAPAREGDGLLLRRARPALRADATKARRRAARHSLDGDRPRSAACTVAYFGFPRGDPRPARLPGAGISRRPPPSASASRRSSMPTTGGCSCCPGHSISTFPRICPQSAGRSAIPAGAAPASGPRSRRAWLPLSPGARGRIRGAGWVLASLVPVSHLVPLAFRTVVAEYWAYIPSVGFVILVCAPARGRPGPPRAGHARARPRSPSSPSSESFRFPRGPRTSGRRNGCSSTRSPSIRPTSIPGSRSAPSTARGASRRRRFTYLYEARRRDPKARGLWMNLANLYDMRGDTDSAAFAYRKELETFPYKDDVRINLADVLIQQGARRRGGGDVPRGDRPLSAATST